MSIPSAEYRLLGFSTLSLKTKNLLFAGGPNKKT